MSLDLGLNDAPCTATSDNTLVYKLYIHIVFACPFLTRTYCTI